MRLYADFFGQPSAQSANVAFSISQGSLGKIGRSLADVDNRPAVAMYAFCALNSDLRASAVHAALFARFAVDESQVHFFVRGQFGLSWTSR